MTPQPRAKFTITIDPRANADQVMAEMMAARGRLQDRLEGTGLTAVGLPVVESWDRDAMGLSSVRLVLSWKVYSGPWPNEEADRG